MILSIDFIFYLIGDKVIYMTKQGKFSIKKLLIYLDYDRKALLHSSRRNHDRELQIIDTDNLLTDIWSNTSIIPNNMFNHVMHQNGVIASYNKEVPLDAGYVEYLTFKTVNDSLVTPALGIRIINGLHKAVKHARPQDIKYMKKQFNWRKQKLPQYE